MPTDLYRSDIPVSGKCHDDTIYATAWALHAAMQIEEPYEPFDFSASDSLHPHALNPTGSAAYWGARTCSPQIL